MITEHAVVEYETSRILARITSGLSLDRVGDTVASDEKCNGRRYARQYKIYSGLLGHPGRVKKAMFKVPEGLVLAIDRGLCCIGLGSPSLFW